ncbi:MAG: response regulator [Lachnospiraceae bacterium]|jgi:two-component system response regulator YesN|nr:response regulator [Lachnospiraceae bacterium]
MQKMYQVLLVEDEILVREAIASIMDWEACGFSLAGDCANGTEAVEFMQNSPVDVVLTDINMPFMDGMRLSRHIYENYPETRIIIFSGYGEFEFAKQAIQYKVFEYILKPVTADELREVMIRVREKLDADKNREQSFLRMETGYRQYTRNESLLIAQELNRLFKGTGERSDAFKELLNYQISFDKPYYRIGIADVDAYSDMMDTVDSDQRDKDLITFVVENICNEILSESKLGSAYRDSDDKVLLVFGEDASLDGETETFDIEEVCTQMQDKICEASGMLVSFCVGGKVKSSHLSDSYSWAFKALSLRYARGFGQVLCADKTASLMESELPETKWLNEIREAYSGDKIETLDDVLIEIENKIGDSYWDEKRIKSFMRHVLRLSRTMALEADLAFTPTDEYEIFVTEEKSFRKAFKCVREYASLAAGKCMEIRQRGAKKISILVTKYLQENYSDSGLSLNQVCSHIGVSSSYLCQCYKEETGKTFLEALQEIRMEKAKELLSYSALKNYEIAYKVGFADPHYFTVAFKKSTGMTPREYAKRKE